MTIRHDQWDWESLDAIRAEIDALPSAAAAPLGIIDVSSREVRKRAAVPIETRLVELEQPSVRPLRWESYLSAYERHVGQTVDRRI